MLLPGLQSFGLWTGLGSKTRPMRFESGDRSCWRRLVEAITQGAPSKDLRPLAAGVDRTQRLARNWKDRGEGPDSGAQ